MVHTTNSLLRNKTMNLEPKMSHEHEFQRRERRKCMSQISKHSQYFNFLKFECVDGDMFFIKFFI